MPFLASSISRYFRPPCNDLAVQGDFVLFQGVGCAVGSRRGSGILKAVASAKASLCPLEGFRF